MGSREDLSSFDVVVTTVVDVDDLVPKILPVAISPAALPQAVVHDHPVHHTHWTDDVLPPLLDRLSSEQMTDKIHRNGFRCR